MKKIFIFLFISLSINAQVIDFPDTIFKNRLLSANTANGIAKNSFGQNIKIDSNENGQIEVSEVLLVFELNISTSPINTVNDAYDLTGISNFQNLKILNCNGNQLTSLDLSSLSNLEEINANNNLLIDLNVSNLGQLKTLKCAYNNISSLNLTGLNNLETLRVHSNNLSSLNITETPNLIQFYCSSNNFTSLDLTVLPQLKYTAFDHNNITSVNIENLAFLEEVIGSSNAISSINLNGLNTLRYLILSENNISQIGISNLQNLAFFDISNNPLTSLNCNGLLSLTNLFVDETLISDLNCSQTGVIQLFCKNNQNLTQINVRNNINSNSDPDMLFFAFDFNNLPLLESICMDDYEVYNLNFTDYNVNENVLIYIGDNCNIPTQVPAMNIDGFEMLALNVYPNPTFNSFSISSDTSLHINKVSVYNSIGQCLKVFSSNHSDYDISNFRSGIYYVNIETDRGMMNQKIIKR